MLRACVRDDTWIYMGLYSFYRVSKPSGENVPEAEVKVRYNRLRNRTFWGATAAYSLFYLCRLSMGVVKKPLIDEGLFSASELGIIASAFYFVYAIGKFQYTVHDVLLSRFETSLLFHVQF